MTGQIISGSMILGICSFIHLIMIVWWVSLLKRRSSPAENKSFMRIFVTIAGTFGLLLFSHTIQIWIWAIILVWLGALPDLFQGIYFSLVTYTTLGYGDVILIDEYKVFGAMASVNGLLNFGVSTAFLVAVLSKVLPNHLSET